MWWLIGIAGWLVCVAINSGWLFADIQGTIPNSTASQARDRLGTCIMFGMVLGFFGPIGTLFAFLSTGFAQYGWSLSVTPTKENP